MTLLVLFSIFEIFSLQMSCHAPSNLTTYAYLAALALLFASPLPSTFGASVRQFASAWRMDQRRCALGASFGFRLSRFFYSHRHHPHFKELALPISFSPSFFPPLSRSLSLSLSLSLSFALSLSLSLAPALQRHER